MPVEIEAKMRVPDPEPVRQRLRALAAECAGIVLETNVFLDAPGGRLRAADCGLRVRNAVPQDAGRPAKRVITFKGPRRPGALKSREEIELDVAGDGDAIALFNALGFAVMLSFQKRRESWHLMGCKIEIDELPHLGTFVEVEGPSEREVLAARDALGLSDSPMEKRGYADLLSSFLDERNVTDRTVVFP